MIMAYCRAETPLYGHIFSGGGFSGGDGSKEANIIGVEGEQRWGGGGELNGIFLQFEFMFWNGLGRTLALQSFCITHLINAEILAKFCTTRKTK